MAWSIQISKRIASPTGKLDKRAQKPNPVFHMAKNSKKNRRKRSAPQNIPIHLTEGQIALAEADIASRGHATFEIKEIGGMAPNTITTSTVHR
jgi:hypothetical protein